MYDIHTHFKVTRFILSVYLLFHFISLIPRAEELFGDKMPYDSKLGPTYDMFPNILNHVNPTVFIGFLVLNVILFMYGTGSIFGMVTDSPSILVQTSAAILCYGWACLVNKNVLISNPGIPYVGFVLLTYAVVPVGSPNDKNNTNFKQAIVWISWFLTALGYTISGLHKLDSPSWWDGTALFHVLSSPLARDNFLVKMMLRMPPIFLKINTWFSLFLEISFLPLGVFYYSRPVYWFIYLFFHFGIILTIDFVDLTIGVFMIHVLIFDPKWLNWVVSKGKNNKNKDKIE